MNRTKPSIAKSVLWPIRRMFLNMGSGICISQRAYVAATALLQVAPNGIYRGGRISISTGSIISDGAILAPFGGHITLREDVIIGPYCVLYGHGGLTIGDRTMIAAHTVIIPANHGIAGVGAICFQPETRLGVEIGSDVWIGCGARILDGVRIGNGAVIGAGAVVTTSIPDLRVAAGVPARVFRKREPLDAARDEG